MTTPSGYCCYDGQFGFIRTEYLNADIAPWSDGTFYVTNCNGKYGFVLWDYLAAEWHEGGQ